MTSSPYRSSGQTQLHISTESWPCTDFHAQPTDAHLCVGAPVNTRPCCSREPAFKVTGVFRRISAENTGLDYFPPYHELRFQRIPVTWHTGGLNSEVSALFAGAERASFLIFFWIFFFSCKGNPKSCGIIRSCSCLMHLPVSPSFFYHIYSSKRRVP